MDDPDRLTELTAHSFSPRVGNEFRLLADGETIQARLAEVTIGGRGLHRDQFSLLFRVPLGVGLPQGIYRIDHDEMGSLDLFLVPLGPDAEGPRYEAAFS